ncbi:hypothetical protein D3C75_1205860 [compost metagenome]
MRACPVFTGQALFLRVKPRLLQQLVGACRHDEVVAMQAAYLVGPPAHCHQIVHSVRSDGEVAQVMPSLQQLVGACCHDEVVAM